ncbi:hypothetical protein EVG20_g3365 [Dentipellis fragilis]|uniref:Chromatin assembly factor 1 subunit A dimerization domain-containing protein n=1 Tax=Dentipellis fragilis TaxID=205917 RepID=A0A4Y9Z4B8_9AGAM|nr:hypothetical protein EVG20_g3365 [Dentipellis fragilis]
MADSEVARGKADQSTSNGKSEKKSLVEIKNGKVLFRQKPMSFEKATETMQETVKFREYLEGCIEKREPPLTAIPTKHQPLIAKFVQESDKTVLYLAKHIQQELVLAPDDDDEDANTLPDILPVETIETTIKALADRVNYGIDAPNSTKLPASLCVWRWEVKDSHRDFLPKASRDKIESRLAERLQVGNSDEAIGAILTEGQGKKDLNALFVALPQNERDIMLGVKSDVKTAQSKLKPLVRASSNDAESRARSVSPSKAAEKKAETDANGNENDGTPKAARKKTVDPEKAAKEKERLEKKTAKAEREKKEKEAQDKSRSIMASFFGKPKASTSASPAKAPTASTSKKTTSDFDKTFKPFAPKKGSEVAPVNWFKESKKKKNVMVGDVIITDDDEDVNMEAEVDVAPLSPRSHLKSVVSSLPPSFSHTRPSRYTRAGACFKTYHPDPVRSVITRLCEAEISDDTAAVRGLLAELRDRQALPAKVLIFHEDARPGYFGTFTRRSRIVGPRTAFARDDVAVDYTYDSGEEWGEEEAGGDDVAEASDDDKDEEEASSDLDDWLIDDDEEEVPTPIEEREGMDGFPFPPEQIKAKRKAEPKEKDAGDGAKAKKRKVVVPLVPFIKGPCWENEIGKCEFDPFKLYRVQFFNDTPYPVDPFTFVSGPVEVPKPVAKLGPSTSSNIQFVVPALPAHVLTSTNGPTSIPLQAQPKRPAITPKNPFPETHVPFLMNKIASLGTSSLAVLVDSIHQDLKAHKVKKNAIEVKVREICAKDSRKVWVVKDEIKVRIAFEFLYFHRSSPSLFPFRRPTD